MTPAQLQSLLQQGINHHRAGRLPEALAIYTRIRSVAPRHFDAVHLAGVVALQQGRTQDAVDLLGRALKLSPRSAVCQMRLGLAYMAAGQPRTAEDHLRESIKLQPDFVEAWDNLAYCLKAQDCLLEAIKCHERSTTLNPHSAMSWYNYGLTLSLCGRVGEALRCHERALAVDPGYAKGHYGRAQALQQAHRMPEAVEAYSIYLQKEPRDVEAHSYRLFALNYLEDLSPERLFAEHAAFAQVVGPPANLAFVQPADPARRLRVAVLSPDLRVHSCTYFLEPLLRHLDPRQFEVYLYHDHFREDAASARLKERAAVWRNFVGQANPLVEKTIRADQPDILIDLAGHTGMTSRMPVLARQVAPVQVTYLGYPNTTGVPAIRYRFTDGIADPEGTADAWATERLVRFAPTAWTYLPPEQAPEVGPVPCLVEATAPVTFGCFNNLGKVGDTTLRLWARVLAAVPHSRLLLKGRELDDPAVRDAYYARLAACGLPAERVELLARTKTTAEHLAHYHRIDISLDTFPYHGTTTTCESLWMGVPVVTWLGERHASRVSASLLTALGRTEWIAANADAYVRTAAGLAADPLALAAIRTSLRAEMQRSPLMDFPAQAQRFGDALRACWLEWCASASRADAGGANA